MEYGQYLVKKGDSLYLIAKKYNTTPEQLMMLNNLSSTMIYPNQVLFVPYSSNQGFDYLEYTTMNGDSLKSISDKFNMTPEELMLYNNVYRLELVPNQVIYLNADNYYVIEDKDTLEGILSKNGLSWQDFLNLNNDMFCSGTKIRIK